MKNELRRPGRAWAFLLSLLVPLPLAQPAVAQENSRTSAHPTVRRAPKNATFADASIPRASRRWAPPNIDDAIPPVALDVACSLPEVLQGASQRVKDLVTNLQQFTSTERVEHAEADRAGNWHRPLARSFHYLVSISEVRPGMLNVEETRDGDSALDKFPTKMATTGLGRSRCCSIATTLDLSQWHGQPAWQVHFQQRPDKPARMHVFHVGGGLYPAKLKGRAWISADAYRVVRLQLDLMEAIPKIRLEAEHLDIEYRPVQFAKRNLELWLPESADLYMDFRGHRYHHRHSFSDFLLFSVETREDIHEPPQP